MDQQLLRVLFVDESPDDVEALGALLRKAGYMLKSQRAHDAIATHAALEKGEWDVVLCDFRLAQQALDQVKHTAVDLPLIVVARGIAAGEAERIMRAGARDVIPKEEPARLAPAVQRELDALRCRGAHQSLEAKLKEVEARHHALVSASRQAISYAQDGMHIDANSAYLAMFGFDNAEELEGVPLLNLVDSKDHAALKAYMRKPGDAPLSFKAVKKNGGGFPAEMTIASVVLRDEACQQILVTDISRFHAAEERAQQVTQRDPLTGLYNRHYFLGELAGAIEKAKGGAKSFMLYVDIDRLREINDILGPEVGDRLLIRIARLLQEKVAQPALLARFGGDEFATLLQMNEREQADACAQKIQKMLKKFRLSEGDKAHECGCQVITIEIDENAGSVQQLLALLHGRLTDMRAPAPAPAAAKPAPAPTPKAEPAAAPATGGSWEKHIEDALSGYQLALVYQPIVNLTGEASEQYEALLRMADQAQQASPAALLQAAEGTGQAAAVDRWVIGEAAAVLGKLHADGKKTRFFVNVSKATVLDFKAAFSYAEEVFKRHGAPLSAIGFEVDESVLAAHPTETGSFMRAGSRLGCVFAIDNFGGRLASATHLRGLPVTLLKLDGAVIENLDSDPIRQLALQTLSEIAKKLGKPLAAKHVESAETLARLWQYEIAYAQGNYLQPPSADLTYEFQIESVSGEEARGAWRS